LEAPLAALRRDGWPPIGVLPIREGPGASACHRALIDYPNLSKLSAVATICLLGRSRRPPKHSAGFCVARSCRFMGSAGGSGSCASRSLGCGLPLQNTNEEFAPPEQASTEGNCWSIPPCRPPSFASSTPWRSDLAPSLNFGLLTAVSNIKAGIDFANPVSNRLVLRQGRDVDDASGFGWVAWSLKFSHSWRVSMRREVAFWSMIFTEPNNRKQFPRIHLHRVAIQVSIYVNPLL
jgi:hypothetical protein